MKISIIMPSLNVEKYIVKCLESVINQSLTDIEIICVDAGSTDGTLEIIEEYANKDSRIKIIKSSKKSYGYQMNLGLDMALGEYVGIVETDDYIDIFMYERMYNLAKDNNVDFVKGGYIGFIGTTHVIERRIIDINDSSYLNRIINLNDERKAGGLALNHIWSGLYKSDFLTKNKIRFNETKGASYQDTSFSILVGMLADSCVYTDDCSYYYRMDNSNSSVKSTTKIECVIDEYQFLIDKLKKDNKYNFEIQEIIERNKLITYNWNYNRLNADGRMKFLELIKDEMQPYLDAKIKWKMSSDETDIIKNLTEPSLIEKNLLYENEFCNKLKKFVNECREGIQFNVVGAGRLFSKMITIKKAMNIDFIQSLSDNSTCLQGTLIEGYIVNRVEDVCKRNKDGQWIVLNRYHSDEINNQLVQLGVNDDNIIIFESMIDIDELNDYLL